MARGKIHKPPSASKAPDGVDQRAHNGKRSAAAKDPGPVRIEAQPGRAEKASVVEDFPGTDRHDIPDPMDTTGNEVENGPDVDPSDPNLSAVLAETGGEETNKALGMRGDDTMVLDDPEEDEETDPESLEPV